MWQTKNVSSFMLHFTKKCECLINIFFLYLQDAPFPINVLPEDDLLGQYCGNLFSDTNKSWQPLLSAALGYPQ